MDFLSLLNNPLVNEIVFIGFIATTVMFIFSQVRKQDLKILRDSNTDLRNSIDDKTKEIDSLKHNQSIMQGEIFGLQKKVSDLEDKNGHLQDLVKQALVLYFESNPNIAKGMVAKV